jgi:hypothetical protein
LTLCATISAVIVLALMASAVSYGSVHIGPFPFPPDDNGGNIANGVHIGPFPFPPDDNGGNIASGVHIGPFPFPPDDNGGNIQLA